MPALTVVREVFPAAQVNSSDEDPDSRVAAGPAAAGGTAGPAYGPRDEATIRHWREAHVDPAKVRAWCRGTGGTSPGPGRAVPRWWRTTWLSAAPRYPNWPARHLDGYEHGADRIVVLEDLEVGRLRRAAGTPLCQTPSRAHQQRHVSGSVGDQRRLPAAKPA